ncbi:hypothetical protein FHT77_000475 [Rhizobium sp. BK181]|uniref:hypothetical protein n=1 Tax=Rhizobium sp. BK181 TaxID=2587072 RepID=UPI0016184E99|nr:hypothetical protein [Rhizobium sp. BK181]MBB3314633.1 hypothetical protein [Rhizobium sp. BK181]
MSVETVVGIDLHIRVGILREKAREFRTRTSYDFIGRENDDRVDDVHGRRCHACQECILELGDRGIGRRDVTFRDTLGSRLGHAKSSSPDRCENRDLRLQGRTYNLGEMMISHT